MDFSEIHVFWLIKLCQISIQKQVIRTNQVLNPARPRGSTRDPIDPGLEPGRVKEKAGE